MDRVRRILRIEFAGRVFDQNTSERHCKLVCILGIGLGHCRPPKDLQVTHQSQLALRIVFNLLLESTLNQLIEAGEKCLLELGLHLNELLQLANILENG